MLTNRKSRKAKDGYDLALGAKFKPETIANLYEFMRERTAYVYTSKSELITACIEYLETVLLATGKLKRKKKRAEAIYILEDAFPELEIIKSRDRNNLSAEIDEEIERFKSAVDDLDS